MFAFKKIIGAFVMPTGLVVLVLIASGLWWLRARHKKAGVFNLILGLGVWAASLPMISFWLSQGLTAGLALSENPKGDVIVLLGGGADDRAIDLSGRGMPSQDMMERIVTAVRVYRRIDVPIIVTGGAVYDATQSEAAIVRRFLVDLGVPAARVIAEEKARDTMENARYTKTICSAQGFGRPLLITSLIHYKRSLWCFRRVGLDVTPVPVGLAPERSMDLGWEAFLPGSFYFLHRVLHEYIGMAYYRLMY